MKFVFTIDTESDDAWVHPDIISLKNFNGVKKLQNLCNSYGIIPTYLLAYEYIINDETNSFFMSLLDSHKLELGIHFHAWTTPPFFNTSKSNVDLDYINAYQFELADHVFNEKIDTLYNTFVKIFNFNPRSFRAGRWGIDQRTIDWLIRKDFLLDTSVVPLMDFSKNKGVKEPGPSFKNINSLQPYKWYHTHQNQNFLWEIPVSIYQNTAFLNYVYAKTLNFNNTFASKLIRKLFSNGIMLRPNPKYSLRFYKKFLETLFNLNIPIVNLMIHSSELFLNGSPISRNKNDLSKTWKILDLIFNMISEKGILSCGIEESVLKYMEE